MSEWLSRIESSGIWEAIDSTKRLVDQIVPTAEDAPEVVGDLERLRLIIQFVESRLKATDALLLSPGAMSTITKHVGAMASSVSAYVSERNRAHLVNANNAADVALAQLAQIPYPILQTDVQIEYDAIGSLRRAAEQYLASLSNRSASVAQQFATIENEMKAASLEITNQKTRLDTVIAEYQDQFSRGESERQRQSSDAQAARNQRMDETVSSFQKQLQEAVDQGRKDIVSQTTAADTQFREEKERLKLEAEALLQALEKDREQGKNILHVIGSTGMAGDYQKQANVARISSITWQAIAGLSMVGFIVFAVFVFMGTQAPIVEGRGFNWLALAARVLVAIAFGVLAAYAARQGDRYSELEINNRRYQLELSSIDPYLVNLPIETQNKIRAELAQKFFGNVQTGMQSNQTEVTGTGVDLLRVALQTIQEALKKLR